MGRDANASSGEIAPTHKWPDGNSKHFSVDTLGRKDRRHRYANILRGQNVAVRVVSRSAANLQRAFGDPAFEKDRIRSEALEKPA